MVSAFRLHVHAATLCLAGIDFLILLGAIACGLSLSYTTLPVVLEFREPFPLQIIVFASVCLFSLFVFGVYSKQSIIQLKIRAVSLLLAFILAFGLLTAIFYVLPDLRIWLSAILPAVAISLSVILTSHIVFDRLIAFKFLRRKVLVLGSGRSAQQLAQMFRHGGIPMVRCLGFLVMEGEKTFLRDEDLLDHDYKDLTQLSARDVDEIVVALDEWRGHLPTDVLLPCRLRGLQISTISTFLERQLGRVDLQNLHPSWMIFSQGFTAANRVERIIKRVFDLAVSIFFLIALTPLFLLVVLAIWLADFGPVFYRQTRIGMHGEPFSLYKFRSMHPDAEADGVARWAASSDHRSTLVGRFLRRTRIDEWPQIFNVLRGEMSFIGPRPERPEFVDTLRKEIPFYDYRHTVKPGISGWAQLNYPYGASIEDACEKLKYDLFYIKNYSLLLDTLILLQTLRVVIWPQLLTKHLQIAQSDAVVAESSSVQKTL
jgi:sugar transferase (PEP-CTERM system associated)